MAVLTYDDVMLREPRLLVPRSSPIGEVKMDWSHPLARGCLGYVPLHSKKTFQQRDVVSGQNTTTNPGYEIAIANPAVYGGLSCIDNNRSDYPTYTNWFLFPKAYVLDGCTICCEILKTSAFTALHSPLFNRGAATGINAGAYLAPTKLGLHWEGTLYDYTSGPVLPVGEWVLTAITRQPGSGNQAIDLHAVSFGSGYQTANAGNGAAATFDDLKIGCDESSVDRRFYGYIANARIYNRALSRTELQELFYNPYQMLIPA